MEIEIIKIEDVNTGDFLPTATPITWVKKNGDTAILISPRLAMLIKPEIEEEGPVD